MYFLISGKLPLRPGDHHFAISAEDREHATKAIRKKRPELRGVRFLAWKLTAIEKWYDFELKGAVAP